MRLRIVVASILAGLVASSSAAAQTPPVLPAPDFERIINQAMVPGQRLYRVGDTSATTFALLDLDRDGTVSTKDRDRSRRTYDAAMRAGAVSGYLNADLDGDGVVTREEMQRYQMMMAGRLPGTGGPESAGARQERAAQAVDAMMRADRNGDGRIDWKEMVAAGRLVRMPDRAGFDGIYQAVLAFDADGDGRVTMDEYIDGLGKRFAEYDTDSDEVISRAEFDAYWQRKAQPAPRVQEIQEDYQDKQVAACKLPRAPKSVKVVVLNAYHIQGVSSAAVGPQDEITKASRVIIEPGSEPLYIILIGWEHVIWQFEGQVDRVKRMVLASSAPNRGPPSAPIGETGLPNEVITFSGGPASPCGTFWYNMNSRDPKQTKQYLRALIGRDADAVIDRQDVWNLRLPSGEVSTPTDSDRATTLPLTGPDAAQIAKVRGKFLGYNPGGIVRIDPATVTSPLPVATYDLMPDQAGLVQLMLDGSLTLDDKGRFLIHKPMQFPTGLAGAHSEVFVLLKDVPMPTGNPGHSEVISEETGKSLCHVGKCVAQGN
jgi:Ca2+-binding EF-hand superfamily protein